MKAKPWDRKLWGVVFTSNECPLLIGEAWYRTKPDYYAGEPPRALVFTTRTLARQWCQKWSAINAKHQDCRKDWKFRPVRVREIVQVIA